MIEFKLQLSSKQINLLRWVADGCPDGDERGQWSHFVPGMRALTREKLVVNQHPKKPAWKITTKGRLVLELVNMELKEQV